MHDPLVSPPTISPDHPLTSIHSDEFLMCYGKSTSFSFPSPKANPSQLSAPKSAKYTASARLNPAHGASRTLNTACPSRVNPTRNDIGCGYDGGRNGGLVDGSGRVVRMFGL
jgi:hypothetical protein